MEKQFIHLRNHSRFSVGASTLKIKDFPKLCVAAGMSACALTDTNLMSGCAEFSDVMPKNKVQPIIGIEISLNHHSADPKILRSASLSRIVLLAQNHTGYLKLCELNRVMYMRGENHHLGPYISMDELRAHSDGLICLSGAHLGPIGMAVLNNQDAQAKIYAKQLLEIFGNRFYIEIQRHGLENEIKTEPMFLTIARELNIPIVATNDVCFASDSDYEPADALGCVLGQTKVIDPERPRKSSEQYFKSTEQMWEIFSDLPEACENTYKIAQRCGFMVNVHEKPLLPRFGDDLETECQMLRDNTMNGLKRRLEQHGITDTAPYYEQAEFELGVIIGMGFPGYFLIVADYIDWCRNNDVLTGPGRGSGAGSIVAWALGITNVDPLKYGLLFERFLNPDRISMPDFDVDFEPTGIERVLAYVCDKYGHDSVCRIITFGSLQARGAIRDIGRVYGLPYSKSDRLSKLIPQDAKTLKDAVSVSTEIQDILNQDEDMNKVVTVAEELEGSLRNLGQHACGVVIGDRPTTRIAPVYRDPANLLPSCQYDGKYLEKSGLIKFDFLGLETLVVLKYATRLIQQTRGINIDLDQIPTDDEKTMRLWQQGLTEGIFQFDAPFVQQTLRKMHPTSFLEISALNALNRPGPIAFIPQFIARMHGEEKIEYVHPKAEPILKETYGIIVYQEQVMQLTRALAGFTRGQSDNVRKAMGKKLIEMLNELEGKFYEGCEKEGTLDRATAKDLWEKFKEFAKYAFNKSHAIAYSIVANQCAYLKANYTPEFLAASMSSNLNDTDQLAIFVDDAKTNFNIQIVPPDINQSESLFTVRDGKIVYGLAAIKGVGTAATDLIIAERNANGKFKNLTDFAKRCAHIMNKRILEAFAKVGVLDSLEPNRAAIFMNADAILLYAAKSKESASALSLFANTVEDDVAEDRLHKNLPKTTPWTFNQKLENELSALGFYISAHPLDQYKNLIARSGLVTSATLESLGDRKAVQIAATVNSFSRRRTKTGKEMITINASDSYGNIDAVAFGDSAIEFAQILGTETVVILSGKTSARDDRVSIFVDSIIPLAQWVAKIAHKISLDIWDAAALADVKKAIVALPAGHTRVELNLHGADKVATMMLPGGVELGATTAADIAALGGQGRSGLTMKHIPVLLDAVLNALGDVQGLHIVDCTFGAGGYTRAFLERGANVTAFDRDPNVLVDVDAVRAEYGARFNFIPRAFSSLAELDEQFDAIVFDLGISSMQIDNGERGFSFRMDAPLDMRMDNRDKASILTAAELIENTPVADLAKILRDYGDVRNAMGVARAIKNAAPKTTFGLRDLIHNPKDIAPIFQALRIAVNDEMGELERALDAVPEHLKVDGKCICVTFHSIEDRIVKNTFREWTTAPGDPRMPTVASAPFVATKTALPDNAELENNPRARSAHMRGVVKVA